MTDTLFPDLFSFEPQPSDTPAGEPTAPRAEQGQNGDEAFADGPVRRKRITEAELLADLNPPQREAVLHAGSPVLVVAGAGSGKTRVLTRRIAHLVSFRHVHPGSILAITFTNKAAAEMRHRVVDMVGNRAKLMWVSTFHSACVRMLRADIHRFGISRTFSIYDDTDAKRLMTLVLRDAEVELPDEVEFPHVLAAKRFDRGQAQTVPVEKVLLGLDHVVDDVARRPLLTWAGSVPAPLRCGHHGRKAVGAGTKDVDGLSHAARVGSALWVRLVIIRQ